MQTQLRSLVAVAVAKSGSCSSDSTPSLGTSICPGCSPKKKKRKKKKRKKKKNTQAVATNGTTDSSREPQAECGVGRCAGKRRGNTFEVRRRGKAPPLGSPRSHPAPRRVLSTPGGLPTPRTCAQLLRRFWSPAARRVAPDRAGPGRARLPPRAAEGAQVPGTYRDTGGGCPQPRA